MDAEKLDFIVTQRIKEYFKEKHLSINAASKLAGMNQTTLNRQLNGTNGLSCECLAAIVAAFDELSAEWLLRGKGSMGLTIDKTDEELQAVCIDQAKEILRLKLRVAELEGEKKLA